jgi:hypothetical protein
MSQTSAISVSGSWFAITRGTEPGPYGRVCYGEPGKAIVTK